MKRKSAFLLSIIFMLSLTSCEDEEIQGAVEKVVTGVAHLTGYKWDHEILEEYCQNLAEAITNKDMSALKSLFSPNTLTEAENFDKCASELFDFFEGEVVYISSHENYRGGKIEYGKHRVEFVGTAELETPEFKYYISVHQITRDDFDSDEVGIHGLGIVKTPEFNENWSRSFNRSVNDYSFFIEFGEFDKNGNFNLLP